MWKTTNP